MKTIIIYTTKYGCAEKAAYLLRSKLGEGIEVVNLMLAKEPSLDKYDTVILGGSIYFGKIQKEMTQFVVKHQNELNNKRLGLFICAGTKAELAIEELKSAFPEELYNKAVIKEVLGDEIYPSKLSLMDRFVLRMIGQKNRNGAGLSTEKLEKFAFALK